MKFAYEDLSEDQFETLVVLLCQRLLGMSVQGFAKGADGGRDARFNGTAELLPSKSAPWVGTTVVQAKHTNGFNRSFSERDFYSDSASTTVLGHEIPRIKKLRDAKELDHYMLFANRKLPGNAEADIRRYLASSTGVPEASIYLCGSQQLELWMKSFPEVARIANLDPVDSPLIVSPDDLAEVVQALARQFDVLGTVADDPPALRTTFEQKNVANNMTAEYAKDQRTRYLKDAAKIREFLASPENMTLLQLYEHAVDEFQAKILSKRKDYQTFDEVMQYLLDLLFSRDAVLNQREHKRLTRAMLFYMYWNCDIGEIGDAATN
jgi:hypothetical protein